MSISNKNYYPGYGLHLLYTSGTTKIGNTTEATFVDVLTVGNNTEDDQPFFKQPNLLTGERKGK